MLSFFKRLFKIAEAEAHAGVSHLEDPVKMAEQGIRDLRQDLDSSLKSLASVKANTIQLRREMEQNKELATDYEKKAMLLLQKAQQGQLATEEADRLAGEALAKKEQAVQAASALKRDWDQNERLVQTLEANIGKLKSRIGAWEQELTTLKARSKVASASRKINEQLAKVDSSGTIAMLERMKSKVNEEEALAESYNEIASLETSVDDEIDKALAGGPATSSQSLQELKAKMGMLPAGTVAGALPASSSAATDSLAALKDTVQSTVQSP
ncbi:MAG: PspA/IM30 family protein [Candidatus Melainabacteria bacterium]|nr:PspA/IM30 family protein [Candidatus Melainabacteria bacterium]